jgi:hypothetical protein
MSGDEYMRLERAFASTTGYDIYWQIHSVIVSHGVFAGNHKELHQRLLHYADSEAAADFFKTGRQVESNAELREIIRLIHNYVAAVKMLVDHTRIIARELLKGAALVEYEQKVDADFKGDEASRFLHRLRDYLLHITNAPIVAKLSLDGSDSGLFLSQAELLAWKDWSPSNREFIKTHKSGIHLLTLVDDYDRNVQAFYEWLIDHFYDSRKTEMDEFWEKQRAWAAFCEEHGIEIRHYPAK